jgi:hypothetical protein
MTRSSIPFAQLVREELANYPHDALGLPDAIEAAGRIFVNVILRQHGAITLDGQLLVEPIEAQEALGRERRMSIARFAERNRHPQLPDLIVGLVVDLFGDTQRNFFDTDEIPALIEAVSAAAIICRESYPELCRFWLEGGELPQVGDQVVKLVHERLMIDEHWTVRFDNGFTWIANNLEQRIEWEPHYWDFATWGTIVRSSTVVLRDVEAPSDDVRAYLAGIGMFASASTWHYDDTERVLRAVCQYFFHEQSLVFRAGQHADFSILQLYEAERLAPKLADELKGEIAVAVHPVSGWRTEYDDMLNVVRDLVQPQGAQPSRFADDAEIDLALSEVDGHLEMEHSAERDRIKFTVPLLADVEATIRLNTSQQHPWYGAGLSVATVLEMDLDDAALVNYWSRLVEMQLAAPEGRGYGSWAVADFGSGRRLSFCRFVPNMTAGPGVLRDVLTGEAGRTRMLREWLAQR